MTEENRRRAAGRVSADTPLSRREAMLHGVGGFALICSFDKLGVSTRPSPNKTAAARRGEMGGAFQPFQRDLPIPPVAQPVSSTATHDLYEMTMQEGTAEILPGYDTPIRGYEGIYPGPTIKARKGRQIQVHQTNDLDHETIVHLHGGVNHQESDGALHDYWLDPGDDYLYTYPNRQEQATLWYHDHVHGQTGDHIYHGLTGFYLLGDNRDAKLDLPRGKFDVPLMIQDRAFNEDGSLRYTNSTEPGMLGDTILVNGAIAPRMAVKRRIYRLRFLNASNARCYQLKLGNGRDMWQIASDAGLLPKPVKRNLIPLAPAERVEVLVDFRNFRPGAEFTLRNTLGDGSTVAVMRFDVTGGGGKEQARIPKKMRPAEAIPFPSRIRPFVLSFQTTPFPQWLLNGLPYDRDRIDAFPRLGTTELWRFINESEHQHPLHIHGCHFRVIDENGQAPHPGDRHWKDTTHVPAGGTVTVQPLFKDYEGTYVFHCHTVEHEDMSMMGQLEITA